MPTFIKLKAGPQAAPDVTGLSDITYIPDGGVVTFTTPIKIGKSQRVTFDGRSTGSYGTQYQFVYAGGGNSVFVSGDGGIVDFTVRGFDFGNSANTVFDGLTKCMPGGKWLTYNGTPDSCLFSNLVVDTFKVSGKTDIYQGPWEANLTYHAIMAGCTLTNGVVVLDPTTTDSKFRGMSIYGLHVDGMTISGTTAMGNTDYGIFFINGTVSLKNIHRTGGYGYLLRLVVLKLAALTIDQTCEIRNCIDTNSTRYGTVDCRTDTAQMNSKAAPYPIVGADFTFMNNDSGDKTDGGYYVTNAVVAGQMNDETGKVFKITIGNSIAWNAANNSGSNGSSLLKNNSNGVVTLDMSNNIDLPPGVPLPAGYFIPGTFTPLPGGKLDGKNIGAIPSVASKQRTVIKTVFTYDDGTTSSLP